MLVDFRPSNSPDIRVGEFLSFLHVLTSYYPLIFSHLNVLDSSISESTLQFTFGIAPDECASFYHELAEHYGITPCEFTTYKMVWRDHTIAELYEQLYHEATQAARLVR